ncbi:MAG: hypothetical protein U9N61_05425 [Euryarchaeota archaeon]|nr:hypothetical protein [Euryarchaeota archaeon]
MKERTKPKGFGIAATVLLATLLIAAIIAPSMSAQVVNEERILKGSSIK